MSKLFNYDNPVIQFMSKVFDVIFIGVLWFIGCLPIITVGAATTATYKVLFHLIRDDASAVATLFFQSFRENFKQSTLIWMIFLGIFLFLLTDLFIVWFFASHWIWTIVFAIILLLTLLAIGVFLYVFPLQACFYNTIKGTVKNAFLFAIGYLPRTILMLLIGISILALLTACAPPLLLFSGSFVALPNVWLLNKIFINHEENVPANQHESEQ